MSSATNRTWSAIGIVACVGLVQPASTGAADLPTRGMHVPELAVFDRTIQDFMADRGIEAGLLGIMKDGCAVYERGFGWRGQSHTVPLPKDAMMRIQGGSTNWAGTIARRVELHAPLGSAVIGQ